MGSEVVQASLDGTPCGVCKSDDTVEVAPWETVDGFLGGEGASRWVADLLCSKCGWLSRVLVTVTPSRQP